MWCRRAWLVSAVLSLLLLVACASPEVDASVVGSPSPTEGTEPDGTSTTGSPATDPPEAVPEPQRLTLRPVLVPAVSCDAPREDPDATATTGAAPRGAGDVLPLADPDLPGACTEVGQVALDGTDISSAVAQPSSVADGGWEALVTVAEASRDRANVAFNACADGTSECPATGGGLNGQLAFVLDDEIISSPVVNSRDLADAEFVINGGSGGFTQGEAEDLVRILGADRARPGRP